MTFVDTAQSALIGSPPDPNKKPNASELLQVFSEIYSLLAVNSVGINWTPNAVRVRSTANVAIATALENGDTLNGVTLATGNVVFLGSQTNKAENGLYTVLASGAATRASWANTASELARLGFLVREGTVGKGELYVLPLDTPDINLGTTLLDFSLIGGLPFDLGVIEDLQLYLDATFGDTPNLYNPNTAVLGYQINADGTLGVREGYWSTDYIPVEGDTLYTFPRTLFPRRYALYNASNVFLTQFTAFSQLTTSSAARFVRGCAQIIESPPEDYFFRVSSGHVAVTEAVGNQPKGYARLNERGQIALGVLPGFGDENLFDKDAITVGSYIDVTGAIVSNAAFYTTDFIPVEPGYAYVWSYSGSSKFVNWYDRNKVHLLGETRSGTGSAPPGAAFLRIDARYSEFDPNEYMVYAGTALPDDYVPFAGVVERTKNKNMPNGYAGLDADARLPAFLIEGVSPLSGKKIAALGDSITYGFIPRNAPGYPGKLDSWLPLVAETFGATFQNEGISGSTLSAKASAPSDNAPMVSRFDDLDDDADLVIVMGGTNDARISGIALGAMGDNVPTTFYGALNLLCVGLLNKYRYGPGTAIGRNKKIMFMTSIRLLDASTGDDLNAALPAFNAATKQVCAKYAIPVFDAYNFSGLTPELFRTLTGTEPGYTDNYNPYVTDGTHPTQEGHYIFRDAVAGFIRTLY